MPKPEHIMAVAREWIAKAENDLKNAANTLKMGEDCPTDIVCTIPPEVWNRIGTKLIPKLRSGSELKLDVDFSATLSVKIAAGMEVDIRQTLEDLGLGDSFEIEKE